MKSKPALKPIQPADNFDDAYRALSNRLEDCAAFRAYYVERKDSPVEMLKRRLLVADRECHILYSGQRKSGKTTELLRLAGELQDKYMVVFLSVFRDMEPSDIEPIDLLLLSATRLCEVAIKAGVKVGKDVEKDLADWLLQNSGEAFQLKVKEKTKGLSLGAKLKYLIGEVGGNYRTDSTLRTEIRTRLGPRAGELAERIEILAAKTRQTVGKDPLILIDDLEKVDLATQETLFRKHAATLTRPRCRIIYTVDKALEYEPYWNVVRASFPDPVEVPSICTVTRTGAEHEPGLALLHEILLRRIGPGLFHEDALDKLIRSCNGVLDDLLSIARLCCLAAPVENAQEINWSMVDRQYQTLTDNFRRMIPEAHFAKLGRIHATHTAERDEQLVSLLHMQAAIEYRDESGLYYGVHPAVIPLLREKKLIQN